MSKRKKIRKLTDRLDQLEKILSKNCLTITNSENENEKVTLSFVDGVVEFKKITKKEETITKEISEITF